MHVAYGILKFSRSPPPPRTTQRDTCSHISPFGPFMVCKPYRLYAYRSCDNFPFLIDTSLFLIASATFTKFARVNWATMPTRRSSHRLTVHITAVAVWSSPKTANAVYLKRFPRRCFEVGADYRFAGMAFVFRMGKSVRLILGDLRRKLEFPVCADVAVRYT